MAMSCYNNKPAEPFSHISLPSSLCLFSARWGVYCKSQSRWGWICLSFGCNVPIMKQPDFLHSYEYNLSCQPQPLFYGLIQTQVMLLGHNCAKQWLYFCFLQFSSLLCFHTSALRAPLSFLVLFVWAVFYPDRSVEVWYSNTTTPCS